MHNTETFNTRSIPVSPGRQNAISSLDSLRCSHPDSFPSSLRGVLLRWQGKVRVREECGQGFQQRWWDTLVRGRSIQLKTREAKRPAGNPVQAHYATVGRKEETRSAWALLTFWAGQCFVGGSRARPVHCKMFSSILCLHLTAVRSGPFQSCDNKKDSRHC